MFYRFTSLQVGETTLFTIYQFFILHRQYYYMFIQFFNFTSIVLFIQKISFCKNVQVKFCIAIRWFDVEAGKIVHSIWVITSLDVGIWWMSVVISSYKHEREREMKINSINSTVWNDDERKMQSYPNWSSPMMYMVRCMVSHMVKRTLSSVHTDRPNKLNKQLVHRQPNIPNKPTAMSGEHLVLVLALPLRKRKPMRRIQSANEQNETDAKANVLWLVLDHGKTDTKMKQLNASENAILNSQVRNRNRNVQFVWTFWIFGLLEHFVVLRIANRNWLMFYSAVRQSFIPNRWTLVIPVVVKFDEHVSVIIVGLQCVQQTNKKKEGKKTKPRQLEGIE